MCTTTSLFLGQVVLDAFDISLITGTILCYPNGNMLVLALLTRFALVVGHVTVPKQMFK